MHEHEAAELAASKEKMLSSFKGLISGAEDLLRSTAGVTGEGVESARSNVRDWLDNARGTIAEVQSTALERYRQTTAATDAFVRAKPWQSIGIAAVTGVVIGFLAGRR